MSEKEKEKRSHKKERNNSLMYDISKYSTVRVTANIWKIMHVTLCHSVTEEKISTVQYDIVQYSTVQHSTVQHSIAQHSTAQHSTA